MRSLLVPSLLGLLLVPLNAAEPAVRITTDVSYLAPERAESFDLYLPTPPAAGKLSPAVVWIHGGGWSGGTKNEARAKEICTTRARGLRRHQHQLQARRRGVADESVGLQERRPLPARARCEYHLDPQRIAVAGGSAGGPLALMVAFTAGKPGLEPSGAATPDAGISSAVRCAIVMYGPTDLPTRRQIAADGTSRAAPRAMGAALKIFGAAADGDEVLWIASPVTHVAKDSPPVLMLHGRAGITVDYAQSEEFARVLKERGVKYQFVLIEGIGHTFAFERWVKIKWRTTGAPSGSNFWRAICNNAPARLSALSPTRGLGHCFRSDKAAWGPVAPPSRKIRATDGGATHCFATNHRARRPTPDAEKVRNGP